MLFFFNWLASELSNLNSIEIESEKIELPKAETRWVNKRKNARINKKTSGLSKH